MKNKIKNSEPNYYANIPANVRYCEKLTANAKLLYGEITALCNKEGYCWASNKYFADLYKVEARTISNWIRVLKEQGLIKYEIKDSCMRKIFIMGVGKNLRGGMTKFSWGVGRNLPHNNTSINNTNKRGSTLTNFNLEFLDKLDNSKRISALEEKFKRKLSRAEKEEIKNFVSYWTEKNQSGMKQRWQLEKTFDYGRRIGTWFRNMDNFGNNKDKPLIIE